MFATLTLCAASLCFGTTPVVPEKQPAATQPPVELLPIEQSIVQYTNYERSRYGLPALVADASLMQSARRHTTWMTTNQSLVHSHMNVAENIAMGQADSRSVLQDWMNSSGHRANILNGGHRRIGVAAYRTPGGTIYWCQQFLP